MKVIFMKKGLWDIVNIETNPTVFFYNNKQSSNNKIVIVVKSNEGEGDGKTYFGNQI